MFNATSSCWYIGMTKGCRRLNARNANGMTVRLGEHMVSTWRPSRGKSSSTTNIDQQRYRHSGLMMDIPLFLWFHLFGALKTTSLDLNNNWSPCSNHPPREQKPMENKAPDRSPDLAPDSQKKQPSQNNLLAMHTPFWRKELAHVTSTLRTCALMMCWKIWDAIGDLDVWTL